MNRILLFLLLCPFVAEAQQNDLKPIGSDLLPTSQWTGYYWQSGVKTQYTYDGVDIRAKDLGQYILASGNETAIREFNAYMSSRSTGTLLVVVGTGAAIGGLIGIISARSDANSSNPFQGPPRSETGPSGAGGFLVGFVGTALIGTGWGMRLPGPHLRRAVQYYNRTLRQQQPGISWKLQPYSTGTAAGIGLVGRL